MGTNVTSAAYVANQIEQKVLPIWNRDQGLTAEGGLFVATNPTPGTAIATTTSITTEDQTKPVLLLQNGYSATDSNAKNLYPISLNMLISQVPTSATDWQLAIRLDLQSAKYTSGGSTITPVNCGGNSSATSPAKIYFGAVVGLTMSTSLGRLVSRRQINSVVPVTKDQWYFSFGDTGSSSDQIAGGAGAKNVNFTLPPIVLAPQWWLAIDMWGGSNAAAPSWEFELVYAER